MQLQINAQVATSGTTYTIDYACQKYILQRQKLIHKLKNLKCKYQIKKILQRKDALIETCNLGLTYIRR